MSDQQIRRALSQSLGPYAARPPPPSQPSARRPGRAAHPAHSPMDHPPAHILANARRRLGVCHVWC